MSSHPARPQHRPPRCSPPAAGRQHDLKFCRLAATSIVLPNARRRRDRRHPALQRQAPRMGELLQLQPPQRRPQRPDSLRTPTTEDQDPSRVTGLRQSHTAPPVGLEPTTRCLEVSTVDTPSSPGKTQLNERTAKESYPLEAAVRASRMTRRSARLTEGMCPPRAAVRPRCRGATPCVAERPAGVSQPCVDDDEVLWGALRAGAAGVVLKDAPAAEMLAAIRVTARGGAWLDPRVAERVLCVVRDQRAPDRGPNTSITP